MLFLLGNVYCCMPAWKQNLMRVWLGGTGMRGWPREKEGLSIGQECTAVNELYLYVLNIGNPILSCCKCRKSHLHELLSCFKCRKSHLHELVSCCKHRKSHLHEFLSCWKCRKSHLHELLSCCKCRKLYWSSSPIYFHERYMILLHWEWTIFWGLFPFSV